MPSPVSELAQREGLPLLRPELVGDPDVADELQTRRPDLGVVVAFGQFLPRRIRHAPTLGFLINAHASLLPRYRGAAPIARAILAGESETGVSVMRVEREMDAGPVLLTRELRIEPEESAGELSERLAALAADAVTQGVDRIAAGNAEWTAQDESRATYAPKLEPGEARLDWTDSVERLARRVRAMAPKPGAFTTLGGTLLRILAARALSGPTEASPGTVRRGADPPLRIAARDGWLAPLVVQRSGKRALPIAAFLRGRPIADGERLGDRSTTARMDG